VISDLTTESEHVEDWAATTEPLLRAVDAAVQAVLGG
jgi:hypothetical protein